MAKANAVSGSTVYVADGQNVPADVPDGVRLVGPGAPAEPEVAPAEPAELEPEVVDAEPGPESAPEVEAHGPPGAGEAAATDDGPAAGQPPRRPAGNASTDAWREYVGALPGIDGPAYAGWSELGRAELQEIADELEPR